MLIKVLWVSCLFFARQEHLESEKREKLFLGYLVEKPHTEDDLEEVVDDQHAAEFEGRTVLHVGRSEHFHNWNVRKADGQRHQWRAHEQPVLNSHV